MTIDNMTGITKGSCTVDNMFCKSQLITCKRVKECNGVCPFEDALKQADKRQTMNEQHIINHDRDWIIGCIEHDGFIKTHRFDKANQIILDALSADRPTKWIPVSERLPIPPTFCLVTTDGSHGDVIDIALYMSDGWHKASDVIAWMPLPMPYREDGEA